MDEPKNQLTMPIKETTNVMTGKENNNTIPTISCETLGFPLQPVLPNNQNIQTAVVPNGKGTATSRVMTPIESNKAEGCSRLSPTSTAVVVKPRTTATPSSLVDLDMSIQTERTETVSFTKIIEAAMENYHQFSKESSKLSQVWLACDENKQISMEEALTAAVTDLMNMQSLLLAAEQKIAESEAAALVPTIDDNLLVKIASLEADLAASEKLLSQQANQKQRIIANLKKNKAIMTDLEAKLAANEKDLSSLSAENETLRMGIATITESRDSHKNRLRSQQEIVKESRATIQDLEKRLRRTEQARALEGELLEHFRRLAVHTG